MHGNSAPVHFYQLAHPLRCTCLTPRLFPLPLPLALTQQTVDDLAPPCIAGPAADDMPEQERPCTCGILMTCGIVEQLFA